MERMVTGPSVTHVLMFSDKRFSEKANKRERFAFQKEKPSKQDGAGGVHSRISLIFRASIQSCDAWGSKKSILVTRSVYLTPQLGSETGNLNSARRFRALSRCLTPQLGSEMVNSSSN